MVILTQFELRKQLKQGLQLSVDKKTGVNGGNATTDFVMMTL